MFTLKFNETTNHIPTMRLHGINYSIFIMLKPRIRVFTKSPNLIGNSVRNNLHLKWQLDRTVFAVSDYTVTKNISNQVNFFYDLRYATN